MPAESRLAPNGVLVFDIICLNLRSVFNVGKTISSMSQPINFKVFQIRVVLCLTKAIADRLKQSLMKFTTSKILQYPALF